MEAATQQQFEAEVMAELRMQQEQDAARDAMLEEKRRQDAKTILRNIGFYKEFK